MNVLVVDDEPSICWSLKEVIQDEGCNVTVASSAEEALKQIDSRDFEAIFLDVRLPGMDGLTALEKIRRKSERTPVILMTAYGDLDTAVQSVAKGAFEYLTKPFDLDSVTQILGRAIATKNFTESGTDTKPKTSVSLIVGQSPAMQRIFKQIALAAACDSPVLITGESGTGKELVAQAIVQHGKRSNAPFLPVNVAAMSSTVIESELFGHVKGAFTGADHDRKGVLELASNGTVLFDEVGDIPLSTQVKLLRAIEYQQVFAVGDAKPRKTDFRVLAATNRKLEEGVSRGEFREDLFFRLNVIRIDVPPLRERKEDVVLLANHFLAKHASANRPLRFSQSAIDELNRRTWQGNVRELKNAIEYAVVATRGLEIAANALPAPVVLNSSKTGDVVDTLREAVEHWAEKQLSQSESSPQSGLHEQMLEICERALFAKVSEHYHGNKVASAQRLGIHRATLRQKLRQFGEADQDE